MKVTAQKARNRSFKEKKKIIELRHVIVKDDLP